MNQIVVGHFEPDGSLIYLPLGFKPDYFEMLTHGATAPLLHRFYGRMEDDEASGSQEGVLDDGDGTLSKAADDGGFAAYDSESAAPTITTWTTAVSTAATARTATAHGTYVRPSTTSDTDREAVFECVTAGTGGASEPTWPAGVGENVTDGSTVWQRVNVPTERAGYQGVRIAAALMTDAEEIYYRAEQADKVIDHGDVDGWTGGIYGT